MITVFYMFKELKERLSMLRLEPGKIFLKDSNWTFGDENFDVWDLKK